MTHTLCAFMLVACLKGVPDTAGHERLKAIPSIECDANSGGGVEGGVFAVERCICKRQIEIALYPRGYVLGG